MTRRKDRRVTATRAPKWMVVEAVGDVAAVAPGATEEEVVEEAKGLARVAEAAKQEVGKLIDQDSFPTISPR